MKFTIQVLIETPEGLPLTVSVQTIERSCDRIEDVGLRLEEAKLILNALQEQLVRLDLGESDLEGAIKDGENSLSLFPNQAWMNYLVGVAWMQKKDYKKAVDYLKNASSLELQDKDLLSQCFSALGDSWGGFSDTWGGSGRTSSLKSRSAEPKKRALDPVEPAE